MQVLPHASVSLPPPPEPAAVPAVPPEPTAVLPPWPPDALGDWVSTQLSSMCVMIQKVEINMTARNAFEVIRAV